MKKPIVLPPATVLPVSTLLIPFLVQKIGIGGRTRKEYVVKLLFNCNVLLVRLPRSYYMPDVKHSKAVKRPPVRFVTRNWHLHPTWLQGPSDKKLKNVRETYEKVMGRR